MGKSKNKVVDLKPENISEEHLKTLQAIVSSMNKIQFEIGGLAVAQQQGLATLKEGQDEMNTFRGVLEEAYGKFDINIQTGKINYDANKDD